MEIRIRVNAPMSEAQGIKEIIAVALERIADSSVIDIRNDGYGEQASFMAGGGKKELESEAFPETMAKIREYQARKRR